MNKVTAYLPSLARVLLGLIFLVFGLNGFLNFIPIPAPQGDAATFMGGLAAVGYFFPMLKLTEIIVGLALLSKRFVPLALTVLAPITINILAFHSLDPSGLPMALLILILHLGLAWHHRAVFRPLLSSQTRASEKSHEALLPA